jgi:hypothetical protein
MSDRPTCPACQADRTAAIVYGMPAFDEPMAADLDSGAIVLGGCCIGGAMPAWRCGGCDHEWGLYDMGGVSPPPVLGAARVLAHTSGPTRLAIGETLETAEILLFHCDDDWGVVSTKGYASVVEARAEADHWIDADVSKEEAIAYLEEEAADFKCSFCGRRPDQVKNLLARGDARICNFCIADFAKKLAAERES